MGCQIRLELSPRNDFWRNAFFVEWEHQFPERALKSDSAGNLLALSDWLPDLERVAGQCLSTIKPAPADPGRRQIFRSLFQTRSR